jgi:hypothetical protein
MSDTVGEKEVRWDKGNIKPENISPTPLGEWR